MKAQARFPNLASSFFFTARYFSLLFSDAMLVLWIVGGWDSTFGYVASGFNPSSYGMGFHLSTLWFMGIVMWVSLVNLQYGVKSLGGLGLSFVSDHVFLGWRRPFPYAHYRVHWGLGILYSGALTLLCLFAFENVWVPLYNFFQWGDLLWPVYFYPSMLSRNIEVLLFSLVIVVLLLYAWLLRGKQFSLRLDAWALIFVLFAANGWILWMAYPQYADTSLTALGDLEPSEIHRLEGVELDKSRPVLFPRQAEFPQTVYTFYYADTYLKDYADDELFGFYSPDPVLHGLNKAVKALMFLCVAYPLIVRWRS